MIINLFRDKIQTNRETRFSNSGMLIAVFKFTVTFNIDTTNIYIVSYEKDVYFLFPTKSSFFVAVFKQILCGFNVIQNNCNY